MHSVPGSTADLDNRPGKPRIGLVSFSIIPDDPRVRKQGDLLAKRGWDVVGIGLPGHLSPLPQWRCLVVRDDLAPATLADGGDLRIRASRLLTALREALNAQARPHPSLLWKVLKEAALLVGRDPAAALWVAGPIPRRLLNMIAWLQAGRALRAAGDTVTPEREFRICLRLNRSFQGLYEAARGERVDLWLANDWPTLPIVRKLAAETGVPYAYDTHELAIDEYAERWVWRHVQQPVIAAIERIGIKGAAFVTCVSGGIAERLAEFHGLARRPQVVRNIPPYEPSVFRPTGERISVLYHGWVSPGRNLEGCIESVRLWNPEFSLTIRGPANPEYLAHLQGLANNFGVAERVQFSPAVPMVELVRTASRHDVGLFALPNHSLQNVHVLPNKLFEYMMAGLVLCVSDLPEMARIVKDHRLGELIETTTPQAIAAAINRLDRASIDTHKRNALAAAKQLCWEIEGEKLANACERAIAPAG